MSEEEHKSEYEPAREFELGGRLPRIHLLKAAPRYELRIDREGRWFHEGVEIVRKDIRNLFSRNLARSSDGGYLVRLGNEECPVVVEDAPFVVARVTRRPGGGLALLLTDGTTELLDPRSIFFKKKNVPYCRVRDDLEARFSRPAYYQLAESIGYDERSDTFYLELEGGRTELEV